MILSRTTPAQLFKIWAPRWKDRVVLLDAKHVGTHNEIVFIKAKTESLQGSFYISGRDVHMCQMDTNGKMNCYAVPLDILEPLERKS